jgi:hypothetical protein
MNRSPRLVRPVDPSHRLFIVYARVLLQMVGDLELSDAPDNRAAKASAVCWFAEEPAEVALVCNGTGQNPVSVYRVVRERLRSAKLKSRGITFIRWHLRHGDRLHEIPALSVESPAAF